MKPEPQSGLGKAVLSLRRKAGVDQQALGERAGVPASLIADVESGLVDPTWGDMRKVAAALGISLERLSEVAEEYEDG